MSHGSQVLPRRMLEEADAVFVFDAENYEAVISLHPGAAERTLLLGALRQEGALRIEDPFDGRASLYEAVYRRIAGALAAAEHARP